MQRRYQQKTLRKIMDSCPICVMLATFFFLLFSLHIAHTTRMSWWDRGGPDSDDTIFAKHFLWEIPARSNLGCAKLCAEDLRCAAMTSTAMTSSSVTCRGHSRVMTSGGTAMASTKQYKKKVEGSSSYYLGSTWLTKPCLESSECPLSVDNTECFKGQCLCTPGYYYSLSLDACQSSCDSNDLQESVVEYPGWFLALNNLNESQPEQMPMSLEWCVSWCLSLVVGPRCLTLEYHYEQGKCYLASLTALHVPEEDRLTTSANLSYFQRTCA